MTGPVPNGIKSRPARDLFGEIPVTWPEVWLWVETVPHIPRESWRAAYYLKCWNVPDKIRAAKLNGTYQETMTNPNSRHIRTTL
jgi:hypothetical protein